MTKKAVFEVLKGLINYHNRTGYAPECGNEQTYACQFCLKIFGGHSRTPCMKWNKIEGLDSWAGSYPEQKYQYILKRATKFLGKSYAARLAELLS